MDLDVLARAILAGGLFGGLLAGVYWLFKRREPRVLFHCLMIFLSLFVFMTLRYYFLNIP